MVADAVVGRADWLAYVGPFTFPWGQPGSRRVFGIAGSLAGAGYHVVIGSGEASPSAVTPLIGVDGPGSVSYLGLSELPDPASSRFAKAKWYLMDRGRRTAEWLDRQPARPSHVVVYGGEAQYMFHLQRWCRRHGVPLIADVVEWYDHRNQLGGVLGPHHLTSESALRYFNPRCDGIIAISSYLENYYRGQGIKTLRMPPTMDVRGLNVRLGGARNEESELTLVYSGVPGRKDLLGTIIRAVDVVERQGLRVEFRVHGPTRDQVEALLDGKPLPDAVRVLGRIPQQQVPEALQTADFSVLLRRPARYAQAGFPTKFCESLANGTPVITNLTSDIDKYLTDRVEGLRVADESVEALSAALLTAAGLDRKQRLQMRADARQQALNSFDYRLHSNRVATLVDGLRR
jgi:glycosyltransferase involved in cell wall biosynthesis